MDESINIEVNNNHLDYKILKQYKKILCSRTLKTVIYVTIFVYIVWLVFDIMAGNRHGSIIDLRNIFLLILLYEVSSSIYVKRSLRVQKDLFSIEENDEFNYNLIFKEDSIIIKAGKISGSLPYKKINRILKIEKGYFIFYSKNVYLFCETDQLDKQTRNEIEKILKSLSVKWIEG